MPDSNARYDVVAISLDTRAERTIAEDKTHDDAEAIVAMAVMRRGVEVEFFKSILRSPEGNKP